MVGRVLGGAMGSVCGMRRKRLVNAFELLAPHASFRQNESGRDRS